MKSYLELKIVAENLNDIRKFIDQYRALGFTGGDMIQDDNNVYWTFMVIDNGMLNE